MEYSRVSAYGEWGRLFSFHKSRYLATWDWFQPAAYAIGLHKRQGLSVDGLCCFCEESVSLMGLIFFFGEDDIEYCKQYKDGDIIKFACNYYGIEINDYEWGLEYADIQ